MRRTKGFTIYPSSEDRQLLELIAGKTDRAAGRVAVRFIRRGIRGWMTKNNSALSGAAKTELKNGKNS